MAILGSMRSEASLGPWPGQARALADELASSPGRIALVVGATSEDPLRPLADALGLEVISAGRVLTSTSEPPTAASVRSALREARLIDDAGILFEPELALDPIALLRDLSKRHPLVLNWPGTVKGDEVSYSEPGRRDHYQRRITNAVILHPMPRQFPDQSPYRIERIP